jgi:hypothetical protein
MNPHYKDFHGFAANTMRFTFQTNIIPAHLQPDILQLWKAQGPCTRLKHMLRGSERCFDIYLCDIFKQHNGLVISFERSHLIHLLKESATYYTRLLSLDCPAKGFAS